MEKVLMQLTLVNPPYDVEVDVVMRVPSDNVMCSICDKRPPVFVMRDHDVVSSPDPAKLPLGGPTSCTQCLNDQLEGGWVQIVRIEPNEF